MVRRRLPRFLSPRFSIAAATTLGCVVTAPRTSLADNPIVQTNYTSDPAPMVSDGTVVLITTHDENVAGQPCAAVAGYTLCKWFAYTSTDMVNWTDHGTIATWSTFSWAADAAWAPQAVPRNGKFYLYVPLNNASGTTQIGVGVSTSATGPYTDALGKPLITAGCSGATGDIDPTVLIDDDGQAYLYFGRSAPGYVKLNTDMISYSGSIQCPTDNTQTFGPAATGGFPTQYEEGPWIMKHGSTYFLAYAANGIPEEISYSQATSAGGPFTYGGTIMKAFGASFTNHTGIIDFNGHSYFFYHDGALQKGGSVPSNGDGYHRSVCLEEFTYNADGSFPTITPTTTGPKPIASLNPFLQTEAETIAWESGVQTEATSDTGGGMDVTNIQNGDYIKVANVDFGSGATSFIARVAASGSGGTIVLHLDSATGTTIGTCAVAGTGGAQTWKTLSPCAVTNATGKHDLYLSFTGGSGDLFNFNWWQFGGPGAADSSDAGGLDATTLDAESGSGVPDATSGVGGHSGGSGTSGAGGSGNTGSGTGTSTGGTASGTSGSSASGTASGTSGSSASGAASGTSGTASGTGGSATTGSGAGNGSGGSPTDTNTSGGCSCGTALGSGLEASPLLPLAALVGLRRRRRGQSAAGKRLHD